MQWVGVIHLANRLGTSYEGIHAKGQAIWPLLFMDWDATPFVGASVSVSGPQNEALPSHPWAHSGRYLFRSLVELALCSTVDLRRLRSNGSVDPLSACNALFTGAIWWRIIPGHYSPAGARYWNTTLLSRL